MCTARCETTSMLKYIHNSVSLVSLYVDVTLQTLVYLCMYDTLILQKRYDTKTYVDTTRLFFLCLFNFKSPSH